MLAKLVPFPPQNSRRPKVAPDRGPIRLDAETWRSRVTRDPPTWDGVSPLYRQESSPTLLDRLYKLTPFLRRRVGGGSLAVAAVRDGTSFPRAFAARAIPANISQEKNQIIIVGGKPPLKNIRKKTSTTNQPTNQTSTTYIKNVCQQPTKILKWNKFSLVLLWGSFKIL